MKDTANARLWKKSLRAAKKRWPGNLDHTQLEKLKNLVNSHRLGVADDHVMLLDGKWYITHSGLLHLARRNHCSAIDIKTLPQFCDPDSGRWVVKATVFKTRKSRGFVGYGDAAPSNVSSHLWLGPLN